MTVKRRGTLFVVSAPSGAGKTTLCRELRLRVSGVAYSISVTTRAQRPGEIDGIDFEFVNESRFREMIGAGEFAEHAVVHGHLYGTRASTLERALSGGTDVLLDIDTQGASRLKEHAPEAVLIFIMAPSMAVLEQRLRERKSDNEDDITRRLWRAREEIAQWRRYDYLIVNRDVKEALDQLEAIVIAERNRTSRLSLHLNDLEVPN